MRLVSNHASSLLIATALLGCASLTHGQTYPTRVVRLVVASGPGGSLDFVARAISPKLSENLGQQVVVENRAGAGGVVASESVARSAPDGYTLLLVATSLVTSPELFKKVPYDALRDFAPVTQVTSSPNLIVVHPSLPVKTIKELIAFAKARPGQLDFASAGVSSGSHLFMELFLNMTELKMTHVPYKGGGPGLVGMLAGQVPLMAPGITTAFGYVRDGRLRALGVTSAKRNPGAPDIPTIAEAGVPGYEATSWFGTTAPIATPREIVNLLYSEIARVLQQPDVKARLLGEGLEPVGSSPDEFAAYIRLEKAKWAKVIKSARIQPE